MNRSDEEAVRDLIARVNHAWLAKDFAGLGDCFSQSAVMVGPGFEVLGRGRDFFVQSYRDFAQSAAVILYSGAGPLLESVVVVAMWVYGWAMSYVRVGVAS